MLFIDQNEIQNLWILKKARDGSFEFHMIHIIWLIFYDSLKFDDWLRVPTEMGPFLEDNHITQFGLINQIEYICARICPDKFRLQGLHKVSFSSEHMIFYQPNSNVSPLYFYSANPYSQLYPPLVQTHMFGNWARKYQNGKRLWWTFPKPCKKCPSK